MRHIGVKSNVVKNRRSVKLLRIRGEGYNRNGDKSGRIGLVVEHVKDDGRSMMG